MTTPSFCPKGNKAESLLALRCRLGVSPESCLQILTPRPRHKLWLHCDALHLHHFSGYRSEEVRGSRAAACLDIGKFLLHFWVFARPLFSSSADLLLHVPTLETEKYFLPFGEQLVPQGLS